MDKLFCIASYPSDCQYSWNQEKLACNSLHYALANPEVEESIKGLNPRLSDSFIYYYLLEVIRK